MSRDSRRMRLLREIVLRLAPQSLRVDEAVDLLCGAESALPESVRKSKIDHNVELAVRLGIDPKQADQIVRGSIVLPHGTGKSKRVLVFCQGENVRVAEDSGAVFYGGKELVDKIKAGWVDFDVAIATPDMMGLVGSLGKVLGPRGLMPSPRSGTVTSDIVTAIAEYKAGKVEFRADSAGVVHCVVGKLSFSKDSLVGNIAAMLKYIESLKPSASKGVYFRSVYLSATMMPSIAVVV